MDETKSDIVVRVGTAIAAQIAGNVDPGLGVAAAARKLVDPALSSLIRKMSDWRGNVLPQSGRWGCAESGFDAETLATLLARDETRDAIRANVH